MTNRNQQTTNEAVLEGDGAKMINSKDDDDKVTQIANGDNENNEGEKNRAKDVNRDEKKNELLQLIASGY